eukprot:TRINITY_DN12079_c0_g1_i9.p1 TRINITY_DN12079_c0_g1~~TRINITY_DN12079_c0_g1_i9.p1  ORF type:complete len:450 (+),score=143.55 TRINITY_DN12079_c0_g1_i9:75-1424(+)
MPEWAAPIEGVRAVLHLSLVALHAAMTTTAHLPRVGAAWEGWQQSGVVAAMNGGGAQVDVFLVVSAYLLATKLLRESAAPAAERSGVAVFVWRRAVRMVPAMAAVCAAGYCYGDDWESSPIGALPRFAATLCFVQNLLPVEHAASLTTGALWSNSLDMQCGVALFGLVALVRWGGGAGGAAAAARRLRYPLVALVGAAFTPDGMNLLLLGKHSHYGALQSDTSYLWLAEKYNHTWATPNDAHAVSHAYINGMYNPPWMRFGPFAVGALLACQVTLAQAGGGAGTPRWAVWAATGWAVAQLLMVCLPPGPDDLPMAVQQGITAGLRVLVAAAAAVLLYRVLVPAGHPWAAPALRAALSHRALAPVAAASYASYCFHFRILEWLALAPGSPLAPLRPNAAAADVAPALVFAAALAAAGAGVSLAVASAFHHAVERPLGRWATRARPAAKAD